MERWFLFIELAFCKSQWHLDWLQLLSQCLEESLLHDSLSHTYRASLTQVSLPAIIPSIFLPAHCDFVDMNETLLVLCENP